MKIRCANLKCRTTKMEEDFIKVTKSDKNVEYWCSQKCWNKVHKSKFKWGDQSAKGSIIDGSKIYMGGW